MPPSTTFEGRTREEVQAKARHALHAEVEDMRVLRHGRERYGGFFGFFQKQRWVLEVEMPERPRNRRRRDVPAPDAPALAGGMDQLLEETTDVIDVDFSKALSEVLAAAEATVAPHPVPQRPAPRTPELPAPPRPPDPVAISPRVRARAKLIAAGLADHLLPDPEVDDLELALLASLLRLPIPPAVPSGEGDVLVLVGPLDATAALAGQLAPGTDAQGAVVVASPHPSAPRELAEGGPRPVRTVALVGAAVFKRRSAGKRTIVAVDADGGDDHLRRLVDGLRADAVWGVVPAGTSGEQVDRLAARVGGRLDALALYGLAGEPRPAGLIGAGRPVAYVDGWAATPLALAARLIEVVVSPESR